MDFPMFEWNEEESRWTAAHHPFTSVDDEDLDKLTADPAHCRAKSYDLVLNGVELGSGSIRIHRRDVQTQASSRPSASARKKRARASDSCWTRWSTARRRTAESRWGWTGW